MNFGEHLFLNTPAHLRAMAAQIREAGVKPEIEVFDLGQIELARHLIAEGHLARPPLFQLCLGIPWGAPAMPEALVAMRARLPEDAVWSAFGIGREEFPILAVAAGMGGNVRVGLEDNLYLSRRRARAEQRRPGGEGGEPARPSRPRAGDARSGAGDLRVGPAGVIARASPSPLCGRGWPPKGVGRGERRRRMERRPS